MQKAGHLERSHVTLWRREQQVLRFAQDDNSILVDAGVALGSLVFHWWNGDYTFVQLRRKVNPVTMSIKWERNACCGWDI